MNPHACWLVAARQSGRNFGDLPHLRKAGAPRPTVSSGGRLALILYGADQIRYAGLAVPILTEVFTCERAAYASTIGKMPGYGTGPVCTAVLFRQKNSRYRKSGGSPKLRPLWRAATSQHACGFMQDSVIF